MCGRAHIQAHVLKLQAGKKKKTIPVWEQRLEWKAVSLEPQENK